jgi:hypothetical protein
MSDSVKKYEEMVEAGYTPTVIRKASGDVRITIDQPVKKDRYVESIKDKFDQRSQVGIKKYGTTLERDDLNTEDWIDHAIEEAMDFILYLTVLKDKLK